MISLLIVKFTIVKLSQYHTVCLCQNVSIVVGKCCFLLNVHIVEDFFVLSIDSPRNTSVCFFRKNVSGIRNRGES